MRCSAWTGSSSSSSSSRCRRRRQCAARAAAEAEAQQQAGALVPDRQGYRSFQLEEAEFLVAQTPEGKLDLRDVYVAARGEGGAAPAFTRLQAEGAVPQPQDYHDVPWYTEYPGDALAEKLGKQWVRGAPLCGRRAGQAARAARLLPCWVRLAWGPGRPAAMATGA
jgi:hypothetical protein